MFKLNLRQLKFSSLRLISPDNIWAFFIYLFCNYWINVLPYINFFAIMAHILNGDKNTMRTHLESAGLVIGHEDYLSEMVMNNESYTTGGVDKEKRKEFCRTYTSQERRDAMKKLTLASNNFLLSLAFFGFLLSRQKFVDASTYVPTAAVDGEHFFYNVGFINKLTVQEIQFLLCHEMLHLIYGHLLRINYPNGLPRIHKLFNIAADYNVNADSLFSLTINNQEPALPDGCYYKKEYSSYTTEEIYEILIEEVKEHIKKQREEEENKDKSDDSQNKQQSGSSQGGSGQGGSGQTQQDSNGQGGEAESEITKNDIEKAIDELYPNGTWDDHSDLSGNQHKGEGDGTVGEDEDGNMVANGAPDLSKSSVDKKMENFKGNLIVAKDLAKSSSRQAGRIPAGVVRALRELEEPVFNWRQYIKKDILGLRRREPSWMNPRRRAFDSGIILPGKKKEKMYKIHISMDTSGSVTDQELNDFLSEIYGAARQLRNVEITIWTFDGAIHNVQTFTKNKIHEIPKYKCYGNGGTDFMKNWDYMIENKIQPDIFIMFTDGGYFGEPGIPNYCDTLYVIHNDHSRNVNIDKKYGKTIWYKKDSKTKRKA